MLPRLFQTLNLFPGPIPEAPVSNESYMWSFLSAGVWMRCLAVEPHVAVLANRDSSRLQRFAATIVIYQQVGLSIEDALATPTKSTTPKHIRSSRFP